MTARDAVQIRVGTLADCEAVAQLLIAMGYPVEIKSTEERMRELIADGEHNLLLVATVGIVVAGVVAGHLIPMLQQEQPLGRITALAVDEDQRAYRPRDGSWPVCSLGPKQVALHEPIP